MTPERRAHAVVVTHVVAQTRERYVRTPRLCARADGGATLYVLAWQHGAEALEAIVSDAPPSLVLERAELARSADDVARHGGHVVEVRRDGARSHVVLRAPGLGEVLVWSATGTAAAPAVARAGDGTWVAFHHDVREDTGERDVAKWIALRFVDSSGGVYEPEARMIGLDRELAGEEQSFELPSLAVSDDGALAIFGRGSHRFWWQQLGATGFGERSPLGEPGWGCRGRRVAVARLRDGTLLTARREKEGVVVAGLSAPSGGPPRLRPTPRVIVRTPSGSAHRPARRRHREVTSDGRLLLFGDLHQHTAHSDGIGTFDEPYVRARHVLDDDFCAVSDHESFIGKRFGPGEWALSQAAAERHHESGRFATLFAYEWTARMHPGPGHKCVYFAHRDAAIVSRDDVPEGRDLVARIRALGGIAVPHHIGWTGADEGGHDPVGQPVWEICSCHGCYETADHALGGRGELRDQTIDHVLARGSRFGFVACSDSHGLLWHPGTARRRDPFRTGLTAVQARACTREAILDALATRRCYATSGAKIVLDLRVGGAPMGADVASARGAVAVSEVRGTAAITRLALVGPSGVLAEVAGRDEHARLEHTLRHVGYLYAFVDPADGEMAWARPIFAGPDGAAACR